MSTPFFSTLTALRRKKYTQFEPLIIHQKKPQLVAMTRVAVFLFLKITKKASSFSHSDFLTLFHKSRGLKIMAKVNLNSPLTMEEAFESFLFSKSAQGLTDKTLKSYKSHFKCISKYLDTTIKLNSLM